MAAFAYDVCRKKVFLGNMKLHVGKGVSSGGATGGDIDTGMKKVYFMVLQPKGSAVTANQCAINEAIDVPPIDGSAVTVVTDTNLTFAWLALGVG